MKSIKITYLLKTLFLSAPFLNGIYSANTSDANTSELKKDLGYCCFKGKVEDACCQYESIEEMNNKLYSILDDLTHTTFFRYYKIDLWKKCPFWKDAELLCTSEKCAVPSVEKEKIPEEWNTETLSKVTMNSPFGESAMIQPCDYNSNEFCIIDDESGGSRYVDLPTNPEKFTGYQGEPANRVWASIYSENCFGIPNNLNNTDVCTEKRVFYKLISGLHASISTHICSNWLDTKTGTWSKNLDCFIWKLGKFPDRIENLYLNYAIYIRAINKISDYLENYRYCNGNEEEDLKVTNLIKKTTEIANIYPPTFDESQMFKSPETRSLIDDTRFQFRNVSRIMDCISCEKCRLWGKLQITGLGTALKILFGFNDPSSVHLKRTEIVSLFNGFAKLADSLNIVTEFRNLWKLRDEEELKKEKIESQTNIVDMLKNAQKRMIKEADGMAKKINNIMGKDDQDEDGKIIIYAVSAMAISLIFISLFKLFSSSSSSTSNEKESESAKTTKVKKNVKKSQKIN